MKPTKLLRSEQFTIYHNPKCTKSRAVLALLREHGVEPIVVEYLKTPLNAAELRGLLRALRIKAHEILRTKEDEYRELKLSPDSSEAVIVEALAVHPVLMERPVVVAGNRAVVGRPPEKVLDLLAPPAKLKANS